MTSGTLPTVVGRRLVLDQLHQVVLVDDLARRHREVAADRKLGVVGLADAQVAAATFHVLGEHLHAAHQILGVGRDRLAQQFRIGDNEVGRREGVGDLPRVEGRLVLQVLVELGLRDELLGEAGGHEVELLQEVEEGVLLPLRVLEARIPRIRLDDRLSGLSRHGLQRLGPQVHVAARHLRLGGDGARRVLQPEFGDMPERLGDVGDTVRRVRRPGSRFPWLQIGGERLATQFHHAGDVGREALDIHCLEAEGVVGTGRSGRSGWCFAPGGRHRGLRFGSGRCAGIQDERERLAWRRCRRLRHLGRRRLAGRLPCR